MHRIAGIMYALWLVAAHAELPQPEIQWITQEARTPTLYFSVAFDTDFVAAETLQIKQRGTNKNIQEIFLHSAPSWNDPNKFVEVLDANFDNHPDFAIPYADGGAGPNHTKSFYLYNPEIGRFSRHSELSELPQPVVNKNGTITSSARGGCCQHSSETYRFIAGKMILVADWDESYTADGKWIITTDRELRNGSWVTRTTRRKQASSQ